MSLYYEIKYMAYKLSYYICKPFSVAMGMFATALVTIRKE